MWISILPGSESNLNAISFFKKGNNITDIINRLLALERIKIKGVQKITISLGSEKGEDKIFPPVKGVSPVVNIMKWNYDFSEFNRSSEAKQNELILSLIDQSISDASMKFAWSFDSWKSIIEKVKLAAFRNSYWEWPPKISRDRKTKAGVEINGNEDECTIAIVFSNENDIPFKKIELIKTRPTRFFVSSLLGTAKWVSNNEFELIDKKEEIHFKASLNSEKAEVYFTPKNRKQDAVIDDLLIIASTTSSDLAISLLEKKINDESCR